MSTHTAEEFKHARFATHPDGRIAARMDPYIKHGWASMRASSPLLDWLSDEGMARDGWSPLDETRLPRVVTDEDVDMALCRYYGKVHPHEEGWDEGLRQG